MPHATATRMAHIYSIFTVVSYRPPSTVEEGDMATFFVQDLGLAPVAKTCFHRPQAMSAKLFTHIRTLDCVRPKTKSNSTPKVGPMLKLNNYKATTNTRITHVFRTKVHMATPLSKR